MLPPDFIIEVLLSAADSIVNPPRMEELGLTPKIALGQSSGSSSRALTPKEEEKMMPHGTCGGDRLMAFVLGACQKRTKSELLQGYVEGEFVYVASPLAGALETLSVQRGAQVKAGDPLFALECGAETAARDEARNGGSRKGRRSWRTRRRDGAGGDRRRRGAAQAGPAALVLSEKEFARQDGLWSARELRPRRNLDRARAARDQDRQRVSQLEADLKTAQLGSRSDQIAAAEADVHALEAALAKAEWDLAQKQQNAPQAGLVFDTLYRAGEWVAAGRPVVALLPPANIKVRAFVPETRVGSIHPGDRVRVFVDGVTRAVRAAR